MSWRWLLIFSIIFCSESYATREDDIKAVYIYNFAKFVEWPELAQKPGASTLELCIGKAGVLSGRLLQLNGRLARGLTFHVRLLESFKDLNGCQMLFLEASDVEQQPGLLKLLGKAPILTISDAPDFTLRGGMIGFFVESNRVQFSVNISVVEQAGLRVSSRMLQVAHVITPSEP